MRKIILIFLSTTLLSCIYHRDSYFKVKGELLANESVNECYLGMFLSDSNHLYSKRPIGNNIDESFVILGQINKYYFRINCNGINVYQSKDFILGGEDTFGKIINLGKIKR
ncbi:MAG: hypothetical protein KDC67_12290 [Ignavibacteriae bacterium]|nr:hypothetical protein [Ignavibacteriota bacterium]